MYQGYNSNQGTHLQSLDAQNSITSQGAMTGAVPQNYNGSYQNMPYERNTAMNYAYQQSMQQSNRYVPQVHRNYQQSNSTSANYSYAQQNFISPQQEQAYHASRAMANQAGEMRFNANVQNNMPNHMYNDQRRMEIRLQGDQTAIPVPIEQEIHRRKKFIETPKVELHDVVQPTIYNQKATHQIPNLDLKYSSKFANLTVYKDTDKFVDKNVNLGYLPKYVSTTDVRQVPRPVPKYIGEQEIIEIEVPQIEYANRYIDKEIVVDVKEKVVPKYEEVEREVEVVQYEWKQKAQDVPLYKYVPKFDVELDCPPPLIVPYPETQVVNDPVIIQNNGFCGIQNCFDSNARKSNKSGCRYRRYREQESNIYNLWGLIGSRSEEEIEVGEEEFNDDQQGIYYPASMPRDFASFFQKPLTDEYTNNNSSVQSRTTSPRQNESQEEPDELEASVEYKGAINKPAKYGGELDPLTFKLHAIEVHQFIDIPNLEAPAFVKVLNENSGSGAANGLEKLFSQGKSGWADPSIAGVPATLIQDIIENSQQERNTASNVHGEISNPVNLRHAPAQ